MQADANGISVHYEIAGSPEAPWLVCIHSLATDLSVFDAQVDAFARTHRVLRLDLRGHGGTSSTPPPYTIELLVADVVAVMDVLEIERADIVGLSIGAILGLGLAIDHAGRVDRLVVSDARSDAPEPYVAMWDTTIARANSEGIEAVVDGSMERWFTAPFRERKPPALERLRARAVQTSLDGFIGCARAVQGLAYLPRLHEITAPTLFLVGSDDPAAPPAVMEDMAGRVAGSRFVVLPEAGHLTSVEQPEAYTAAVTTFLAEADSTAPA
jgi:3-oxoadipate enol-lactonase